MSAGRWYAGVVLRRRRSSSMWLRGRLALGAGIAIALVMEVSVPSRVRAAPADSTGDRPPDGRGLIVSGSVVMGVGMVAVIPGVVMLIAGRGSREGLASAIGGLLVGVGGVFVATGTGLLVPGLVRRRRYREYHANRLEASFGLVPTGQRASIGPGGFALRF
jgi:hypothetical protein